MGLFDRLKSFFKSAETPIMVRRKKRPADNPDSVQIAEKRRRFQDSTAKARQSWADTEWSGRQ